MTTTTMPDLSQWLTTTEAARILKVSTTRVLQMITAGQITDVLTTRLGRHFNPEEIEFLRQQRDEEKAAR